MPSPARKKLQSDLWQGLILKKKAAASKAIAGSSPLPFRSKENDAALPHDGMARMRLSVVEDLFRPPTEKRPDMGRGVIIAQVWADDLLHTGVIGTWPGMALRMHPNDLHHLALFGRSIMIRTDPGTVVGLTPLVGLFVDPNGRAHRLAEVSTDGLSLTSQGSSFKPPTLGTIGSRVP